MPHSKSVSYSSEKWLKTSTGFELIRQDLAGTRNKASKLTMLLFCSIMLGSLFFTDMGWQGWAVLFITVAVSFALIKKKGEPFLS
jgi:hypothetical protein